MSTVDGHVYERVAIRQWLLERAAQSTSSRPGASAHAPSGAPRQHQIELRAASSPSQPRPAPALGQLGGTFWLVGHTGPGPDTNPNLTRHDTSPKTGEALEAKILIPCHVLRGMIIRYQEDRAAAAAAAAAGAGAASSAAAAGAAAAHGLG